MHDVIKIVAHFTAMLGEGIAADIIIAGIASSVIVYGRKTLFIKIDYPAVTESRNQIAHALSLALEFLIAADILKTAISPTWQYWTACSNCWDKDFPELFPDEGVEAEK